MNANGNRSDFLLEQWSRGIGEITAALESQNFDHVLLKAITRLVGIDFLLAFAYRGRARPMTLGCTIQGDEHRRVLLADYTSGPYLLDPFFHAALNGTKAGCYRLISVAPDHFRQSEYYQTHYHRTNIGDEIGCFFELPDEVTGVLSLIRWQQHSPVSQRELSILRAIEPGLRAICSKRWSNVSRGMAKSKCAELDEGFLGDRMLDDFESFGGPQLSSREHQIVSLVLQGHSTESIARHFDISPGTVKVHRRNIYRKLGISSQAELFAAFLAATRERELQVRL